MRYLLIVKSTEAGEAGAKLSEETLTRMMRYNEEMAKAGVLLAAEKLQPSAPGALWADAGPVLRRERDRDRWAVRRGEGAERRLRAVAGELKRRGGRVAQARPVRGRRDRASPPVRGGRFR